MQLINVNARAGYLIMLRKGPVTNVNFSKSGHSHKIMQV